MIEKARGFKIGLVLYAVFLLFIQNGVGLSQEMTNEELGKKYEMIIGDYEFDLADLGGDYLILKFYVQDNNLWADSGDGRPAILEPDDAEEFKFGATDPESGYFEITFLKDEDGEYTICRVYIENDNIEITGHKIR